MCILFFAVNQHKDYPVIICANRDEFHQRPTEAMHWWQQPEILAGKDLQAGGSWLGLNKQGRFAALTNFRQPLADTSNKKSRGELVVNAIANTSERDAVWSQTLQQQVHNYQGYNLIYGDLNKLYCFNSTNQVVNQINDGFHSVSNGALDDIWPKMALGIANLQDEISLMNKAGNSLNIERLFDLMTNQQQATTEKLPQTGIPQSWEQLLSSIFIVSPDYGTRSTTIITLDSKNNVTVYEKNYDNTGRSVSASNFTFSY